MADTLALLAEAERMSIVMRTIQDDIQRKSGEIAEIEVQIASLVTEKEAIEGDYLRKLSNYDNFIDGLPEEMDKEKFKKIAEERIKQLADAGLLEGISTKPSKRGRRPGTKNATKNKINKTSKEPEITLSDEKPSISTSDQEETPLVDDETMIQIVLEHDNLTKTEDTASEATTESVPDFLRD
jgi:hypothetical protein